MNFQFKYNKVFPSETNLLQEKDNEKNSDDFQKQKTIDFEEKIDFSKSMKRNQFQSLTEQSKVNNEAIKNNNENQHIAEVSEENEEDLKDDIQLNRIEKLKRNNNQQQILSTKNNKDECNQQNMEAKGGQQNDLEQLADKLNEQLDFNTTELFQNEKSKKQRTLYGNKFLLYPDEKNLWDIFFSLALIYTAIFLPFQIAFIEEQSKSQDIINLIVDITFLIDMALSFFSAYYDNRDNLVTRNKKIFKNYMFGWFFPDLIGVFPFDKILQTNRYGNLLRLIRLPRLSKLLRLTKLIRIARIGKNQSNLIQLAIRLIKLSANWKRLLLSIFSILLFSHIAACLWFLQGSLMKDSIGQGWQLFIYNEIFDYCRVWEFEISQNKELQNLDYYVASLYWVVQTVVTIGFGDIHPSTSLERLISFFIMFVGVFFYSFTIGALSSLLQNLDTKNANFNNKLKTLQNIKHNFNISPLLFNRIKRALKVIQFYYIYIYQNKYGLIKTQLDKQKLLNQLPINLRIELSLAMYKDLISGIQFFQNKPPRFIAFIGPFLKQIKICKDEYIIQEGEFADEMYFIKKGQISIVIKKYDNFQFMSIKQGYYFGEVDLLFGETRNFSYMADEDCLLLSLNKKDFNKIFFQEFREIGSQIYKNALKRRIRVIKVYEEALEYCKQEEEVQHSVEVSKRKQVFQPYISFMQDLPGNSNNLKEISLQKKENKIQNSNSFKNNEQQNFATQPEVKKSQEQDNQLDQILEMQGGMQNIKLSINNIFKMYNSFKIEDKLSQENSPTNLILKKEQSYKEEDFNEEQQIHKNQDKFFSKDIDDQ